MTLAASVGGRVAPGYEPIAAEFERGFRERDELGAAFAVVRDAETLVDLWGGMVDAESAQPWESDTLQILFSGTKGLTAACILLLIDRERLRLDEVVAHYWPEFAAHGKDTLRVRDVMCHTAGLPGLEQPVTWREATDARRMASLVAAQPQSADPRGAVTYHALTFGWMCGELVRRVDGRTLGRFFAEEIAGPLGLELWIGLPAELESRVSTVELADSWGGSDVFDPDRLADDPLRRLIYANPQRYEPDSFPWNEREWHAAEVPGANAIGTPRSLARFYASLDKIMSGETLALGRTIHSARHDPLLGAQTHFGIGFQLQTGAGLLGGPDDAFGHGGSGGSTHGCWPTQRIGFSYAMNRLRDDANDDRAAALLAALYACVQAEAAA